MTATRALAVCTLVVLAGCTGALGPFGSGDDGPSPPPGVEDDAVNATVLLDAHVASLENESFTATLPGGPAGHGGSVTARVSANDTARVARESALGGTANVYVADGRSYWATDESATEYVVSNWSARHDRSPRAQFAAPPALRQTLGVVDGRASPALSPNGTVERDGRTLWRLDVEPSNQTTAAALSDVHGRVLATPDGRIVEAAYHYDRSGTAVNLTYELSAVEETVVERPDWVDDARRHGDYRGFGSDDRRLTTDVPAGFSGESRGLVTLVGVPERANHGDVRARPVGVTEDPLGDAVVAWYASVQAAASHDHAFLTFQYNESLLPANGSESELDVYRYSKQEAAFVALDADVDTEENEASVRVDDANGLYVVFHTPTYERLRERLED
ncbi:DUF7537 family lipoprotein [Halobacterium wangiae]|uniref:DUF7537 family lipoprotein n=1 Tax=Halobacterium wangiae TaxID=2902623 RepID=UPI001E3587DA|nr:hypothetical protein [Halobacterium wangiae]